MCDYIVWKRVMDSNRLYALEYDKTPSLWSLPFQLCESFSSTFPDLLLIILESQS